MRIEIIAETFQLEIYGFGGIATNQDYSGTAFRLSAKMWEFVKANNLSNKGKNIWIYDSAEKVFAGVELDKFSDSNHGLEKVNLRIDKYAYYKHIGPYNLIKHSGQSMKSYLTENGYKVKLPYIEIYGHWTSDETKLETELFMCLA
jgi:effector-binding domain-containing protein